MKSLSILTLMLGLAACGSADSNTKSESKEEVAEIAALDSIATEAEELIQDLESSTNEIEDILNELDN